MFYSFNPSINAFALAAPMTLAISSSEASRMRLTLFVTFYLNKSSIVTSL